MAPGSIAFDRKKEQKRGKTTPRVGLQSKVEGQHRIREKKD